MFILVSIFLSIIIFIAPINVNAIQGNLDLSSAQTSVGKRFAKVFCDAKREGLDSDFASEYALYNTYLKFVAFIISVKSREFGAHLRTSRLKMLSVTPANGDSMTLLVIILLTPLPFSFIFEDI